MKLSTQDMIANFIKEFDKVHKNVKKLTQEERLRFSSSVRGAWNKARENLNESLELAKLSDRDSDPGRHARLNSTDQS